MWEKMAVFNYQVKYLPGSQNHIADFLSMHPQKTQEAPGFPRQKASVMVRSVRSGVCVTEIASLWRITEGGQVCDI